MANQFKVAVEQTTEELQHRYRRATTAHTKDHRFIKCNFIGNWYTSESQFRRRGACRSY
jgi:hypothetical protein